MSRLRFIQIVKFLKCLFWNIRLRRIILPEIPHFSNIYADIVCAFASFFTHVYYFFKVICALLQWCIRSKYEVELWTKDSWPIRHSIPRYRNVFFRSLKGPLTRSLTVTLDRRAEECRDFNCIFICTYIHIYLYASILIGNILTLRTLAERGQNFEDIH